MKRLVFELMLIVILFVVSCKYYNFRQETDEEINRVYQVLVTAKKANEAQNHLIKLQDDAILELIEENSAISEQLEMFRSYRKI